MATSSRIVRIAAVCAVGALGALVPVGASGAVTYPNPPPPEVAPKDTTRTPTSVEANRAARPSTLPITGTDAAEIVAIGGASVGLGFVLARRSRRVRTTT
jgi:LPXTG-motif cell wall-anchored protein